MKIKRKSFVFHNLIYTSGVCASDEWYKMALTLRNIIVAKGLYINAPMIYTCAKKDEKNNEYTLYMPINAELKAVDGVQISFIKELLIKDAFVLRLADIDPSSEAEAHTMLESTARSHNCILEHPFYNVCLNVFDETMLDIIAPVKGGISITTNSVKRG